MSDRECYSCGENFPKHVCPASPKPCGHHCNHIVTDAICDWCKLVVSDE